MADGSFTPISTTTLGGQGSHMMPPYYADFLRENLYSSVYLRQLGTLVTIPRGHGNTVRISNWAPPMKMKGGQTSGIAARTAFGQYAEGTVASAYPMSAASITGFITSWVGARGYTDKAVITVMADLFEGALETLGREGSWVVDDYVRAKISANAFYVDAYSGAGAAPITKKVPTANTLHSKNLARIAPLMGAMGVPRFDDGTYVGVAHDLALYDILMDTSSTGFIPVARYNDARYVYRGELGEFYGVRWLLSNTSAPRIYGAASTTATYGISAGASGSNAYVFSPDSFFNLEFEGEGVEVIHQPLGSAGIKDVGAALGSIAVKVWYGIAMTPAAEYRIMRLAHGMNLHY